MDEDDGFDGMCRSAAQSLFHKESDMASFLITFKPASENPKRGWPLGELQKLVHHLNKSEPAEEAWRFINRKDAKVGDRVFLLLQGKAGPALIGYSNPRQV